MCKNLHHEIRVQIGLIGGLENTSKVSNTHRDLYGLYTEILRHLAKVIWTDII